MLPQELGRQNHSDMPILRMGTQLRKCPLQGARLLGEGGALKVWEAGGSGSFYPNKCHTVPRDKAIVRGDMVILQAEPDIPLVVQRPQHTSQQQYHDPAP